MVHSTDQTIRDVPLTKILRTQEACPYTIEDDLGLSIEKPTIKLVNEYQVKSESTSNGVREPHP